MDAVYLPFLIQYNTINSSVIKTRLSYFLERRGGRSRRYVKRGDQINCYIIDEMNSDFSLKGLVGC